MTVTPVIPQLRLWAPKFKINHVTAITPI